jgi:hypothetical protein
MIEAGDVVEDAGAAELVKLVTMLEDAKAKLETASLSLEAAFRSRNESEILRAKLADKLARIEAALPAIEAEYITGSSLGPLFSAGYAAGCQSAVAQIRKAMGEP